VNWWASGEGLVIKRILQALFLLIIWKAAVGEPIVQEHQVLRFAHAARVL